MKKTLGMLIAALLFLTGASFAVDNATTLKRAYDQGILAVSTGDFQQVHLTREQIAPLLVDYISKVAKKDYTDRWCQATDLGDADPSYRTALSKLCGYGLMNGHQGHLYPKRALSNAQAIALVMRVADGFQPDGKKGQHRAVNYFERAKTLGFEGISPIYYQKNGLMKFQTFINFLYSTAHPYQTITSSQNGNQTIQNGQFSSSDEALLKLAEILKS